MLMFLDTVARHDRGQYSDRRGSGGDPGISAPELGTSAADLARQLDVPTHRVMEILNGRRAITGDTAL